MPNKKYYSIAFFALCALVLFNGCGPRYTIEDAERFYNNKQYAYAATVYEQLYKNPKVEKGRKSEMAFKAGEAYRNFENYDKAIKSYDNALKKDPNNAQAIYMKGVILQKQNNYRDAIKLFDEYLKIYPGDKDALAKKAGCELALAWKSDCQQYTVDNFKIANTKNNDYAPMVADKKDGILYFTSDRNPNEKKKTKIYGWTGLGFSDLWQVKAQAEKKGRRSSSTANTAKKWAKPEILPKVPNTIANDGTPCFSRRYNVMYFTICNGGNNKDLGCKIYSCKKLGEEWGEPELLSFCEGDSLHNYGQPSLSEDEQQLYFSSDREGGLGGHDIWVVNFTRRGRTWSDPINLGPTINTSKTEMFPYIATDNKLFFSSNGHPGFGGLDLFVTEGTGAEWSTPENMSMPMNSGGDDFGITFDNTNPNHGFMTSNRDGGKGGYDIYEFFRKPLKFTLKGIVSDQTTKKPLPGSKVHIFSLPDSGFKEIITDGVGSYFTELEEKKIYRVSANNDTNYYFPSTDTGIAQTLGQKCDKDFEINFELKSMIEVWEIPIYYDLDKAYIRPDAAKSLDSFADNVLAKYPRIVIELGSHTDCRSSYDYNMDLSQRRADSAVAYLVRKGIQPERMFAKGYGESQLVNDCECEGTVIKRNCSEVEHQRNRRTTIKIVNFNFDPRNKTVKGMDSFNTNKGNNNSAAYKLDSARMVKEQRQKDSAMAAIAAADAAAKLLDSLSIKLAITESEGVKTIPVKVNGSTDLQFTWDMRSSKNTIPVAVIEEWMKSGVINKGDFLEGEKIKAPGGTKLPSNKIKIATLAFGEYEVSNMTFSIDEKVDAVPVLGKSAFRTFDPTSIVEEGGVLKMIPKRR